MLDSIIYVSWFNFFFDNWFCIEDKLVTDQKIKKQNVKINNRINEKEMKLKE